MFIGVELGIKFRFIYSFFLLYFIVVLVNEKEWLVEFEGKRKFIILG